MKILRKEADLKQIQTLVQGTHTRLKYSQSELEMIKKKQLAAFYRVIWAYRKLGGDEKQDREFEELHLYSIM